MKTKKDPATNPNVPRRPRPKGEDLEGGIQRMIEGSDPENGKVGFQNPAHRKTLEGYVRVRRVVDAAKLTTIRNDVQSALTLSRFLDESCGGKPFEAAMAEDMMAWRESLEKRFGLKQSTAEMYGLYVKHFMKYVHAPKEYARGRAVQKKLPYPECVEWLMPPPRRKKNIQPDALLNQEDVRMMVSVCSTPRDKALTSLPLTARLTIWRMALSTSSALVPPVTVCFRLRSIRSRLLA